MKLSIKQKLLFIIVGIVMITYISSMTYLLLSLRSQTLTEAKKLSESYTTQIAEEVSTTFNKDLGVVKGLARLYEQYTDDQTPNRLELIHRGMKGAASIDDRYYSAWISLELEYFDSAYFKPHGRYRYTHYQVGPPVTDTLNLDGDDVGSLYWETKQHKRDILTDPYSFTLYNTNEDERDNIFGTSAATTIFGPNGEFMGLMGLDISLESLNYIAELKPYPDSKTFLIGNNGAVISSENLNYINENIEVFLNEEGDLNQEELLGRIANGDTFKLEKYVSLVDDHAYIQFVPIYFGNSQKPWSIVVISPQKSIVEDINNATRNGVLIVVIGLIILIVVVYYLANNISASLKKASNVMSDLAEGKINDAKSLKFNSGDEIEKIGKSLNSVIENLRDKANFANEIGKGNVDVNFESHRENDVLANSLLEMRENLKNAREQESRRSWITNGQAKFGELLRTTSTDDMSVFYNRLLSELVKYLEINQGMILIINDDNEDDIYLESVAAYAYQRKKFVDLQVRPGEGLAGQCYLEKAPIFITEIPKDYVHIKSGLGDATPNCVFIVPLLSDEKIVGVMELASFKVIEEYKKELILKFAESLASTVGNIKINQHTKRLLEQTREQTAQMQEQEEEMRQNVEELQATQEQNRRDKLDLENRIQMLEATLQQTKQENEQLKAQLKK
ncbi:MAG: GAF domain-containing protein [Cyclobacteriaceae bacterium]|nr:GAF domain-containing protein [Cyclobacteriaceae bacterium]MCH8517819.1 GAF domain-containing protein [Cyclobacteriaceae bacterium]